MVIYYISLKKIVNIYFKLDKKNSKKLFLNIVACLNWQQLGTKKTLIK